MKYAAWAATQINRAYKVSYVMMIIHLYFIVYVLLLVNVFAFSHISVHSI